MFETVIRNDGICITNASLSDRVAVLPEIIEGRPMVALGRHAFSAGNEMIEEIYLPRYLVELGDFAFLGCKSLRKLYFYDDIRDIGGGLFANCNDLSTFEVTRTNAEQGPMLASVCADIEVELDVIIHELDGSIGRVIFPEYYEISDERVCSLDVPFNYEIGGAGYTYHHCFKRRQLSYNTYDKQWFDFLKKDYNVKTAIKLAWTRLSYPLGLTDSFRSTYIEFLQLHSMEALDWMADRNDATGMSRLLKLIEPDLSSVSLTLEKVRKRRNVELSAVLLAKLQYRRSIKDKEFDL